MLVWKNEAKTFRSFGQGDSDLNVRYDGACADANEFAGPPVRPYHNQLQQTQQGPQSPKAAHAKADNQGGKESGEGAPFFVGSGGEVYDVYYRKCDDEVARRIKGGGQGATVALLLLFFLLA
jgi:hypothetical protein